MKLIQCFFFQRQGTLGIRYLIYFCSKNKITLSKTFNCMCKNFKFDNFLHSQAFINKVGEIAEAEGHHPDLWFGWGYARIKIFTHAIKGLAESDFILAAKIDKIINA